MIELCIEIKEKEVKNISDFGVKDIEVHIIERGEGTKDERFISNLIQKRIGDKENEIIMCNKASEKIVKDEFLENVIKKFMKL